MKRTICFAAAAAALLCFAVSCGSRTVSTDNVSATLTMRSNRSAEDVSKEMEGEWETTSSTINGEPCEFVRDKFTFTDNGNGTFYDKEGGLHQITWHITESGGITITYVETDETTAPYELSNEVLTLTEDTAEGVRETCISKTKSPENDKDDKEN